MKWQPIETAPKGGYAMGNGEIIGVRYVDGVITKGPFLTYWSHSCQRYMLDPTHWMPLPEPPND